MTMKLHQEISLLFGGFSLVTLLWNVATPENPDHLLNVIEQSCLCLAFALSYFWHSHGAEALQVFALVVAAFIPMGISDSPFFGAVIATFALVLIYAYGGYRTMAFWKLPVTFVGLVGLCAIATSHFDPPSFDTYGRSIMWALFISLFCVVLWRVVKHIERRFYLIRETELLKLNKELIELNRDLIAGGYHDAPGES